ncbi:uncharacterized protein CCOS01_02141 [Colletotrichum costaricense]|uniref:Uncharacterized protein n=1 Tax=Colletotrichum costaricense TaxID=1209916 RepID=A0AAI9Z782_9PEZI|nr:uncharacterized protein CCOS01_02141 [Colletotrichum costaricense]KAK1536821.1 hypothetical protein CCOS01_02141 [Colletotrichum costaricense]
MQIGTVHNMADARDARKKKKGILRESGHLHSVGTFLTQVFTRPWHQGPQGSSRMGPVRKVTNSKRRKRPQKKAGQMETFRGGTCVVVWAHLARDPATSIIVLQLSSIWRHVEKPRPGPFVTATADTRHLGMRSRMRKQSQQEK